MSVSRRVFLGAVPAVLAAQSAAINRRDVVSRHNPTLHALDPRSPLSVGNGEFAFTADPTGLQTFPQPYESQMPLCTQSQWGWHTAPNPTRKGPADLRLTEFDTFGRKVGYPTSSARAKTALQLAPRKSAPPSPGPHRLRHRQSRRRPLHPADARPLDRHSAQRVRMAAARRSPWTPAAIPRTT